ncbi:MAG: LysR family transcriptional regulator [Acidobacteriia bacterium]|nr:LysR family transcriptional regulator [Terriglobia bacterium]
MNLAALDLNLLIALDALLAEVHVGRAANRIGLSQPAASHALNRLREVTGDPLLVRAGGRMQLTPRAELLREPLAGALDQVRGLFVRDRFDPAASTRRFAMMMPDHVVDLVMPKLLRSVEREAPSVRLDVVPWRGLSVMTADLARSIDVVIACTGGDVTGFDRQRLFGDTEAIAVRRGQPLGRRLRRLDVFREARHVAIVGRGQREDPMDTWLREQGIERRIGLTVPSYLQALHLAARTDLVAFVPKRMIEALAGPLLLMMVRPPVDPGIYEEFLFHPSRAEADPGSIWLRNHVLKVGSALNRNQGGARPSI